MSVYTTCTLYNTRPHIDMFLVSYTEFSLSNKHVTDSYCHVLIKTSYVNFDHYK